MSTVSKSKTFFFSMSAQQVRFFFCTWCSHLWQASTALWLFTFPSPLLLLSCHDISWLSKLVALSWITHLHFNRSLKWGRFIAWLWEIWFVYRPCLKSAMVLGPAVWQLYLTSCYSNWNVKRGLCRKTPVCCVNAAGVSAQWWQDADSAVWLWLLLCGSYSVIELDI